MIQVESLGLPTLSGLIGKKTEVEMAGGNVTDLIANLIMRYGQKVRQILLDQKGDLDLTIQVMVNDSFVAREEFSKCVLKEGDNVKLLLLAGGG